MIDTKQLMRDLDIQDVIQTYTGKVFRNGKVACPFHTDKTPSLSVKNNRFRCWSCGASGSVIDFVREMFGLSFVDAVKKLSKDFGVPVDGLDDSSYRPDLWDDIHLQIAAERAAAITAEIERLANETNDLADEHRELFQAGNIEAADCVADRIEQINDEIDFLMRCRG